MKKAYFISNYVLMGIIVVLDILYMLFGGLWLKALTSLIFVIIGIINLIYLIKKKESDLKFGIFMVVALIIAMLGDITINIEFMVGAIIFAIGHVFYFVSYCYLSNFRLSDLIAGLIIFVPSACVILFVPIFEFGDILMKIICVVYALIISAMVGKSISNLIRKRSLTNVILMIGSILFFISDLMLLFDVFANVSLWAGILCLATYYPGQALLAHSVILSQSKEM